MRYARQPELLERVMGVTVPMRGRMIHGKDSLGRLYEHAQDYDVRGRVRNSVISRLVNSFHLLRRDK